MGDVYQRDDWRELKPHPAAEIFPLMDEETVAEIAARMAERGYDRQKPVTLLDGLILDGRNRLRMCALCGVDPWFVDYEGDDPLDFVVQENCDRRQLNESQRGMAAAAALPIYQEQAKERMRQGGGDKVSEAARAGHVSIRDPLEDKKTPAPQASAIVGKRFGVGQSTVERAARINREAPDLAPEVWAGRKTVGWAWKEIIRREGMVSARVEEVKRPKKRKQPTPKERDLAGWETLIDSKLEAFLDVAFALMEIREKRLFIDQYGEFRRYLNGRWGVPFARGNQVMLGIDALMLVGLKGDNTREL